MNKISIFKKSDAVDSVLHGEIYTVLDSVELLSSIPQNATSIKQPILDNQIEWRWRFFEIGSRKLIEISYTDVHDNRKFIDQMGEPITYNLDSEWDKFVVKTLYAYVNCDNYN